MNPYQTIQPSHPGLPPLRLVNRRTYEHAGACPFCGGDPYRSDRFHVWLEPGKERFWCRACNAKGTLRKLLGEQRAITPGITHKSSRPRRQSAPSKVEHQAQYRRLYTAVALWAHENLLDPANPEPMDYLRGRGLDEASVRHAVLGVTRRDPAALVDLLRRDYPELLPFAESAGVLSREHGELRAHPNLCGCLLFPYIAGGEIVDLRTRSYPGKGYKSLPGGYGERGAIFPFGWDELDGSDTILLTEGEFKALAVQQAYHAGRLSVPAFAHPGLSYLREEWPATMLARGVRTVILAYDSQPRPIKDGLLQLAPEEIWSIRHGQSLAATGLTVKVLRLPLPPGETKADLDEFLLKHGPARLQQLIDTAPTLESYQRSLPRGLMGQARLSIHNPYPTRRARPQRLAPVAARPAAPATISLDAARAQIADLARSHALNGQGFLALAHPPGTGKGHNTIAGLRAYLQEHAAPGQIVWTALRKDQLHDQQGLDLVALHGRNSGNCRRLGEAQALAARAYSVHQALCQRRCPFVGRCTYLCQFNQEADFFAPQPLLLATRWWQEAAIVVLDEFDPARLARIASLDSADLARMGRASDCPHSHNLLRWLGTLLGSTGDRSLTGGLLLDELAANARSEGLDLEATLEAAGAALPPEEDQQLLPGLSQGASLAEFEALPPNYLSTLITRLSQEQRWQRAGRIFTSRIELTGGRLMLYLRAEHLIAQLARPEQPKIILDATASPALLRAIFPNTPLQIEQPRIAGGARVLQVISRDWAKTTLHGDRREQWYDAVAARIRPGRPTLVICTMALEDSLRAALQARGHSQVVVSHYGAIRGSNAYKGYDVILAQVYHPNLEAVIHEGRALFADDAEPLDERMITTDRVLEDAAGARWAVQVPTFADPRLAALLEHHREAELLQAALRGRPFDHPETQITLMFGLPLPGLPPSEVLEDQTSPESNQGRADAAREALARAGKLLLDQGARLIDVEDLAGATGQSVVTVRKHMAAVAGRLGLRLIQQQRVAPLPRGGQRIYKRWVLVRRGRWAPAECARPLEVSETPETMDQADNKEITTRVIRHRVPATQRLRFRYKLIYRPRLKRRC